MADDDDSTLARSTAADLEKSELDDSDSSKSSAPNLYGGDPFTLIEPVIKLGLKQVIEFLGNTQRTIESVSKLLGDIMSGMTEDIVRASADADSGVRNDLKIIIQLGGFLILDYWYHLIESDYGIDLRSSRDSFVHHIKKVMEVSKDYSAGNTQDPSDKVKEEMALKFDGTFTSRIPWDDICVGLLLNINGVNKQLQCKSNTFAVLSQDETIGIPAVSLSPSGLRSDCRLLALPQELIREILHLGAESFLPAVRSSLRDRQVLHYRRSHFLTHAALSHSIFRQQAQLELISFAYCATAANLNGFLDFVESKKCFPALKRLRLDRGDQVYSPEEDCVYRITLARLSLLPACITHIDFGGNFSFDMLATFQHCESRHSSLSGICLATWADSLAFCIVFVTGGYLSSIRFSQRWDLPYFPTTEQQSQLCILAPSIIELHLDCCENHNFSDLFHPNANLLNITITSDANEFSDSLWPNTTELTQINIFPSVTDISIDDGILSLTLLTTHLPSLTRIHIQNNLRNDVLFGSHHARETYDWMIQRLLSLASLKFLVIPSAQLHFRKGPLESLFKEQGKDVDIKLEE